MKHNVDGSNLLGCQERSYAYTSLERFKLLIVLVAALSHNKLSMSSFPSILVYFRLRTLSSIVS